MQSGSRNIFNEYWFGYRGTPLLAIPVPSRSSSPFSGRGPPDAQRAGLLGPEHRRTYVPFVWRHQRKTLVGAFMKKTLPTTKDMMGAVMRQSEARASRPIAHYTAGTGAFGISRISRLAGECGSIGKE
jgi:hypothetical protein